MAHATAAPRHRQNARETVMKNTILISLTLLVLVTGTFAANLICYSPQFNDGVDPTAPLTISVALN
jgi:hypothetical protein